MDPTDTIQLIFDTISEGHSPIVAGSASLWKLLKESKKEVDWYPNDVDVFIRYKTIRGRDGIYFEDEAIGTLCPDASYLSNNIEDKYNCMHKSLLQISTLFKSHRVDRDYRTMLKLLPLDTKYLPIDIIFVDIKHCVLERFDLSFDRVGITSIDPLVFDLRHGLVDYTEHDLAPFYGEAEDPFIKAVLTFSTTHAANLSDLARSIDRIKKYIDRKTIDVARYGYKEPSSDIGGFPYLDDIDPERMADLLNELSSIDLE